MPTLFPIVEPVPLDVTYISEMINLLFPWVWPKMTVTLSPSWKGGVFQRWKANDSPCREPVNQCLTLLWMRMWLLPLTASVPSVRNDWVKHAYLTESLNGNWIRFCAEQACKTLEGSINRHDSHTRRKGGYCRRRRVVTQPHPPTPHRLSWAISNKIQGGKKNRLFWESCIILYRLSFFFNGVCL